MGEVQLFALQSMEATADLYSEVVVVMEVVNLTVVGMPVWIKAFSVTIGEGWE